MNLLDDKQVNKDSLFRQLIVVGNGLDLYCGLASRFADFFGPRRKKLRSTEYQALHDVRGWEDSLVGSGLTAWDIILEIWAAEDVESKNWSNIEAAIADWVTPQRIAEKEKVYIVKNKHLKRVLSFLNTTGYTYAAGDRYSEVEVAQLLKYVYGQGPWDHESMLDKLLEELHKLESEFVKYMLSTVAGAEGYPDRLRQVFHGVVFDELAGQREEFLESSILNFNYTIPSEFVRSEKADLIDCYANVHGHLRGEIVIGIDATGHMDDPGVAQFTKTYRVMGIGSSAVKGIVYSGQGVRSGPATTLMKFIGHSLSEADYSYFQSLFDTVNLYGGDTRLVFYYMPHGEGDFSAACGKSKKGVMDSVVKLLTRYGETLDNADHGKNLIHKLLLEGRLAVKLVPEAETIREEAGLG